MGRAGNLAGGPRPGGFGGPRGPGSGPSPLDTNKTGQRKPAPRKKPGFVRKEDVELEKELQLKKKAEARAIAIPKSIDIMENISVSDLAKKMNIKPAELIGKLMGLGVMATINQKIDAETATILASEYGCEVKIVSLYDETVIEREAEKPEDFMHRAPIVTVMGHVDHGKTKLLDAIRKTDVVSREYGGITQHIGAYQVETPRGKITFLDTPGHAAFTKMRARGSKVTDIVVLVVSAVEGVMPQTREAIDHAKAAEVPIIVAVNKIDLPESNPDRIKTQLSELGLIPEEWGGTTQFCEISALQKKGIPELLDAILLQAEILELEASYECNAEAKIIESRIDQGRGIVATIIVEKGTLRIGDSFVAGIYPGRVRAMFDDKGNRVDIAEPSTPVEVLGFEGIPNAGDPFEVVDEEKYARAISDKRQELKKYEEGRNVKKVTLDNLYETISAGEVQELKVIIKGDVQGSVEALKGMLEKLSTKEVRLNVLRSAAGAISDDDVMMASASDAIIIGFNVRPIASAKLLADREKVDIRKYNIIYRAQEDIQKAMEGLLSPELKEQDIGKAEVRNIFKVPKVGIIAGCYMLEGAVHRNSQVRVIREEIEIFQGKITSLKRFKDDAKEVVAGYECGIGIENCNDLKEGDILEIYETVEVARSLSKAGTDGSEKA
jgi:translation initiation factor IF-2